MRSLVLVAVLFVSRNSFAENATEWVVIGVVGKWKVVESGQPLVFGKVLVPGTKIEKTSSPSSTGFFTLINGGSRVTKKCETTPCTEFEVPKDGKLASSPGEKSLWEATLAIMKQPNRYIQAVSRGYGTVQNAVVAASGTDLDLGLALADLGKGDVYVRLEDFDAPVRSASIQHLVWDPETPASGVAHAAGAGLYKLQITDETGKEDSGEAWVLAKQPADVGVAREAFQELATQLTSLKNDVPAASLKALEKAFLQQLASAK